MPRVRRSARTVTAHCLDEADGASSPARAHRSSMVKNYARRARRVTATANRGGARRLCEEKA